MGREVQRDLADNHGREVAVSYLQRLSEAVGRVVPAKEEAWNYTPPLLEKAVETVAIGLDGTCLLLCEQGWREALVGTIALHDAQGERQHTFSFRFQQGRPFVNSARRKCLHIYYYFLDREFGLIHVMVQTWFPMRMQVFVNGHNWLANKLAANGIRFSQCDNAFLWIEDIERAQRFADRLASVNWPSVLNG